MGCGLELCWEQCWSRRDVSVSAKLGLHHWDLLCSSPQPARGLGAHKDSGGTQLGQLSPTDPRGISNPMASCSAYRAGGRRRRGDVQSSGICLPQPPSHEMEPCFPGDGWAPACGKWLKNTLLCLYAQLLFSLLNCLYPQVFFPILFPIPLQGTAFNHDRHKLKHRKLNLNIRNHTISTGNFQPQQLHGSVISNTFVVHIYEYYQHNI